MRTVGKGLGSDRTSRNANVWSSVLSNLSLSGAINLQPSSFTLSSLSILCLTVKDQKTIASFLLMLMTPVKCLI